MHKAIELKIHEYYRESLKDFLNVDTFDKPLKKEEGKIFLELKVGNVSWSALVDEHTHKITAIHHDDVDSPTQKALLNAFAAFSIDHSVQDVAEHSAIRTETRLRQTDKSKPVPGILMPENTDPAFQILIELSKALFKKYKKLTGFEPGENFEDESPSDEWLGHTQEEQVALIERIIPEHCPKTNIAREDVEIKRIDHDVRITIAVNKKVDDALLQRYIFDLERLIHKHLDKRLELYIGNIKDKSAIRRNVQVTDSSAKGAI